MSYHIFGFLLGFLLDLIIGDPTWLPHPIRLIGRLIGRLDQKLYREDFSEQKLRRRGGLLVVLVVSAMCVCTGLILLGAYLLHPIFGVIVEGILTAYVLAIKSLKTESMKVYSALKSGDLEKSRQAVSMIVGRDTEKLDEIGITKAAVETVAENISDGIIAPMFYAFLGGPILAMVYKSINTMDSMIGYRNERYQFFGRAAAKTDDVANFVPSRISAILMIFACFFVGKNFDGKRAWYIFKRDRFCHESPNSAQTESVMAGALGIRLAGNASYFGKVKEKPYIGDATREIEIADIARANQLSYATAFLGEAICLLILGVVAYLINM